MDALTFDTDNNGQLTCPLPGCSAPLNLDRSYRIPLMEFDDGTDNKGDPGDAVADGWQVTCDEGHTIDRNDQESDWREPFRLSWLLVTGHGQAETCAWCGEPFTVGDAHPHDDELGYGYHHGECWDNRYGEGA